MNRQHTSLLVAAVAIAALGTGCDDGAAGAASANDFADPGGGSVPGASGVSPAGAQDFGQFRQILEAGQIPHPDVLDPLGFLAEHKLDYPAPDCGQDICLHALLGVGGNLMTGTNCTLLQLGLNSPIDPAEMDRPPLDLVLALDTSGSMSGSPIEYVKQGVIEMLSVLRPEDRVSIVAYSSEARLVAEWLSGEETDALEEAVHSLRADGSTNLFDGLFLALELAESARAPGRESRVVFLSDGRATVGLVQPGRLQALAEGHAREGIGITTIGLGDNFDLNTMRAISDTGAGNFYFIEDPQAAIEVFTEEVLTFLVPIALDVQIEVFAGEGYAVRGAYGTRGWQGGLRSGLIDQASLFLAGRQRADEPLETGRRGGGGGVLIELMPRLGLDPADPDAVGEVRLSYTDPRSGERRTQQVDITNPFAPGEIPRGGHFTHDTVRKGFVMLNVLVGFQLAAEMALEGNVSSAISVLTALEAGLASPEVDQDDPDLADDRHYVTLFRQNLERAQRLQPVQAPPPVTTPEPWPYD